jgi:O-succinylbenzoate synthase
MEIRFAHRRYSLQFKAPVRTAHGSWPVREGLFVRVERSDGSVGYGEAAPVPHHGTETVDADEVFCRSLGDTPAVGDLEKTPHELFSLRNALMAAMEAPSVAGASGSHPVAALLPAGSDALAKGPLMGEEGFRVFKWKVGGGDAQDEMGLFDDLLGSLPSGSKVRLDANGGWNRRTAERWLDLASARPVEFVEQPISPDARGATDLLLGLASDYPVPIGLDESVASDEDVIRWIEVGWRGPYVIKGSLLGDAKGTLGRLLAAKATVVFSSALETGIGAKAALRTALAWNGSKPAFGFGVWPLFADSRFDGPRASPFLKAEDVERLDGETLWNAAI